MSLDLSKETERRWESVTSLNCTSCCSSEDLNSSEACCWVCLGGPEGTDERGDLVAPCRCAKQSGRLCHKRCLARWQLQSAGTRKERHCEFCGDELPDWRDSLTPSCGAAAPAIMNVNFNGRTYSFEVQPGPHGYQLFTEQIRRAFSLPGDSDLNITFTCDEPSTGSLLTLQGSGAYDAAVHCAAVSAARRRSAGLPLPSSNSPSSGGSSSTGGAPGAAGGKGRALAALGRKIREVLSELFVR